MPGTTLSLSQGGRERKAVLTLIRKLDDSTKEMDEDDDGRTRMCLFCSCLSVLGLSSRANFSTPYHPQHSLPPTYGLGKRLDQVQVRRPSTFSDSNFPKFRPCSSAFTGICAFFQGIHTNTKYFIFLSLSNGTDVRNGTHSLPKSLWYVRFLCIQASVLIRCRTPWSV